MWELREALSFLCNNDVARNQIAWRWGHLAGEGHCHSRCPVRFQLSLKSGRTGSVAPLSASVLLHVHPHGSRAFCLSLLLARLLSCFLCCSLSCLLSCFAFSLSCLLSCVLAFLLVCLHVLTCSFSHFFVFLSCPSWVSTCCSFLFGLSLFMFSVLKTLF